VDVAPDFEALLAKIFERIDTASGPVIDLAFTANLSRCLQRLPTLMSSGFANLPQTVCESNQNSIKGWGAILHVECGAPTCRPYQMVASLGDGIVLSGAQPTAEQPDARSNGSVGRGGVIARCAVDLFI
jgi:hypothetical protein